MSKVLVKQLLTSSNYWTLNKTVVKMFGIETALLLTNLAEAETMMSDKDGWFYQTSETLEKITTLSRYKQDKGIEQLEEAGILEKDVRGIPAKRYFKLDYKALSNKIVSNLQTGIEESDKLDYKALSNKIVSNLQTGIEESDKLECKKLTTNKELSNKELITKESTKEILSSSKERDHIPYKEIVDHLNKKADRKFRHTTNKTKASIRARWNEGFDLEDFKRVIEIKVDEWESNPEFNKYIRPETLFGTKFESYLNQPAESKGRDWETWDFMG